MFEQNFNFYDEEKETIADEIRKLLSKAEPIPSADEYNYLTIWKSKLLKLSGNN